MLQKKTVSRKTFYLCTKNNVSNNVTIKKEERKVLNEVEFRRFEETKFLEKIYNKGQKRRRRNGRFQKNKTT